MTPLQAMQRTLAGEHAAVYVYGVVGGRVSASPASPGWPPRPRRPTPCTGPAVTS